MGPTRILIAALAVASLSACAPMGSGYRMQGGDPGSADRTLAQRTRMNEHMRAMQEHYERLQRATTPEERNTLMAEHMKMMQDAQAMMTEMGCMQGGPGMGGRGMMMMERPPAAPPETKP